MPWIQRDAGDLRWTLLSEWESVLLGGADWPIDRWRRHSHVECVKDGPHRTVYRVATPERSFYVKHYRSPRWTDRFSNLLRGAPARREFRNLLQLARRGIPTLHPIAWAVGRCWRGCWDSFLLTEAVPNAQPLDEYVQNHLPRIPAEIQAQTVRTLLEEFAQFLAQCHQAGVLHRDLHTGNVLVIAPEQTRGGPSRFFENAPGGDDSGISESMIPEDRGTRPRFRFLLIDVLAVRLQGPLDRETSLRNLALLAGAWREKTTPAQRQRFWYSYTEARPDIAFDLVGDAERIDRLGREHTLRICRRRDRRALAKNRDFFVLQTQWGRAYAVADQSPQVVEDWLRMPEEFLERFLHRAVKLGHRSVVVEADWPPWSESLFPEIFSPNREGAEAEKGLLRIPYPRSPFFPQPYFLPPGDLEGEGFLNPIPPLECSRWQEEAGKEPYFGGEGEAFSQKPSLLRKQPPWSPPKKQGEARFGGASGCLSEEEGGAISAPTRAAIATEPNFPETETFGRDCGSVFRVALKRFRERVGWAGWLRLFRMPRARRAWWAGHALLQRGIATPRPIAVCEPHFRGCPYYTYLATQWIPEAENLHLWGWRIAQLPPERRIQEAIRCSESLGRLIGRLHAFRITHGDLKMSNILVSGQGDQLRTWLLDVEGIRIGVRNPRRYLRDLARLALGLQAHPWGGPILVCRFLKAYLQQFSPSDRPDWKILWRKVQEESLLWENRKKREGKRIL